jgi:hypothetical protein
MTSKLALAGTAGFAVAFAAAVLTTMPAAGQMTYSAAGVSVGESTASTSDIRERALRAYRSDGAISIGVVRDLRLTPAFDPRTDFSRFNRFDRSDRWIAREVILGRIDPLRSRDQSVGIVRAYRNIPGVDVSQPRPGVLVFRNANAEDETQENTGEQSQNQSLPNTANSNEPVQIVAVQSRSVELDSDPWVLLNQGLYRDAREQFNAMQDADSVESMTGRALAAALAGDLAGASELMPDSPTLPDSVTLAEATRTRINQVKNLLFQGDDQMQEALQAILDATTPPTAS